MTLGTIITQLLALLCNAYVAFSKNKRHVYAATVLFNIFCLATGLLQRDYALCVSYLIIIYRSVAVLYKQKIKSKINWFPATFVCAHITFGIITWVNWWCLIPIITPVLTGCVMWYSDNLQLYRKNNIVNNSLWVVHNIHSKSYILVVLRMYTVIINIVAVVKNKESRLG